MSKTHCSYCGNKHSVQQYFLKKTGTFKSYCSRRIVNGKYYCFSCADCYKRRGCFERAYPRLTEEEQAEKYAMKLWIMQQSNIKIKRLNESLKRLPVKELWAFIGISFK